MAGFEGYLGGALWFFVLVVIILFSGGVIWATFYFVKQYKKFSQYECFIFYKDGFNQLSYKKDSAGIFVDPKTKNKRFFLKKANVGLDPNNVPVLPGKRRVVFLAEYGLKNFSYVRVNMDAIDTFRFSVGEEDVNWAVNAAEREEKKWQVKNVFLQYAPFIGTVLFLFVVLIMFIYLMKGIPGVMDKVMEILVQATKLAATNQGTTVIPS